MSTFKDIIEDLQYNWVDDYRDTCLRYDPEDDEKGVISGLTCWIFAESILPRFADPNQPVQKGEIYNKETDTDDFLADLEEQLRMNRVVKFDYSDPEMHTFIIIGYGDDVYFIDNYPLQGPGTSPRVDILPIDQFMQDLSEVIEGTKMEYFYNDYSRKVVSEDDRPLFEWVSYDPIYEEYSSEYQPNYDPYTLLDSLEDMYIREN